MCDIMLTTYLIHYIPRILHLCTRGGRCQSSRRRFALFVTFSKILSVFKLRKFVSLSHLILNNPLFDAGELFVSQFSHYGIRLAHSLGYYTITIYPTIELYRYYVTDTPRNICIIVVFIIAFTATVVFVYGFLTKKREDSLKELAVQSFAEAKSRDAVLLAKKVYVRYMSHEMRTPLNTMHLGLKILEKDLIRSRGHGYRKRLATVRDIMSACDIGVAFLNDLLNFGKLEDGLLTINPIKTRALPFISTTSKMFLPYAEEKNVTILFDFGPTSDLSIPYPPLGQITSELQESLSSSRLNEMSLSVYLNDSDYINVDEQKMGQVFRSMISNAIKHSPEGGIVHLKARKIVNADYKFGLAKNEMTENVDCRNIKEQTYSHVWSAYDNGKKWSKKVQIKYFPTAQSIRKASSDVDLESGSCSKSGIDDDEAKSSTTIISADTLVFNVTDSGVGMSSEDCAKVFGNSDEFDPSKLQVST